MVINEQEFRSFIANLNTYFIGTPNVDYFALENNILNKLEKYIKMFETPKPSKWKQLTIDEKI